MKRIGFIILLVLAAIFVGKEVRAEESGYYNLIDMNQVAYNSNSNVFYSDQEITLSKNVTYTFVASSDFFGSTTENDITALKGKSIGVNIVSKNKLYPLKFELDVAPNGLHYSSITMSSDCSFKITDFLVSGYTLDTLPKDEVILYSGSKEEFKGFRKNEYLQEYDKVSNEMTIYTSCTNPIKVEEITKSLICYDNEKGFYNNVILENDSYQNTSIPGDYSVSYKVVDDSNNEKSLLVNVKVVDNEPPVINGPDVIEWDCYVLPPLRGTILRYYSVYDAVDGDLSSKILFKNTIEEVYEVGVEKDYQIVIAVTDNAGNTATKTITIKAYDNKAPELTVQDLTIKLSELGKTSFSNFFEQLIKEVSDNSTKYTLEYEMKEVIGKFGFSGTFEITVIAKDSSGNETIKTANIRVIDDIEPDFYIRKELLNTTSEKVYTVSELKDVISNSLYEDGILYDSIDLISCDYFSNERNPGSYTVKYSYSYKGETNYVVGTINVVEPEKEKSPAILLLLVGIPLVIGTVAIILRRKKSY